MRFLLNSEKALKSGLNLDYFFKIIIFYLYKLIIGNKFFYIVDKYLAEKLFFQLNSFFSYTNSIFFVIKYLNFNQILKISLVLAIQIILICVL